MSPLQRSSSLAALLTDLFGSVNDSFSSRGGLPLGTNSSVYTQERSLLSKGKQGIPQPERTYYMPASTDTTVRAFRQWYNTRAGGGPTWPAVRSFEPTHAVHETSSRSRGFSLCCVCEGGGGGNIAPRASLVTFRQRSRLGGEKGASAGWRTRVSSGHRTVGPCAESFRSNICWRGSVSFASP